MASLPGWCVLCVYSALAVVLYRASVLRPLLGLTPAVRSLRADLLSLFQASPHTQMCGCDGQPQNNSLSDLLGHIADPAILDKPNS